MNVLILGKDPSFFHAQGRPGSDTRARHMEYARVLWQATGGKSTVRIISYTPRSKVYREEKLDWGLTLYPTRSMHKAIFLADLLIALPRVLRGWRPNLVTVQKPWEEGVVGYLLSRLTGSRFLPQIHFDLFAEEWLVQKRLNRWRRWVSFRILKRADGIRVVSSSLKKDLTAALRIPAENIAVIPVGVEPPLLPPGFSKEDRKAGIHPDLTGHPLVIYVGRFHPEKNLDLWIEVARKVMLRVPTARFAMAGSGPEWETVRSALQSGAHAERFHLVGSVGRDRIYEFYAAADVFLLTSTFEGFGRAVLESMLSGVPVVATDCAGPMDLIRDGETGFIQKKGDAAGLGGAVADLLLNPEFAARMGNEGRKVAEASFGRERLITDLVKEWLDVAGFGGNNGNFHEPIAV